MNHEHLEHWGFNDSFKDDLAEKCRAHIANQRATLWGEFFNVYESDGLDAAADWLAAEIRGVFS